MKCLSIKKMLAAANLSVSFFLFSCEKNRFILTFDSRNKPIINCVSLNLDSYIAVAVSMNCQNSISENIKLCSQERMLKYFDSKESCKAEYEYSIKAYGQYLLIDDVYNKR